MHHMSKWDHMNMSLTEVHSKYNLLCATVSQLFAFFLGVYSAMLIYVAKITIVSDFIKSTLEIRTASSKYVLLQLS